MVGLLEESERAHLGKGHQTNGLGLQRHALRPQESALFTERETETRGRATTLHPNRSGCEGLCRDSERVALLVIWAL